MAEFELSAGRLGGDRRPFAELIAQTTELKHITLGQGFVVGLVRELESEDAEVREVLPMDPRQ